jgi:hypothetical protein
MNTKQQKDLITQKAEIIHFNHTSWIRANPIVQALGYNDPAKFVRTNIQPENLKSYQEIKSESNFKLLELHPTTKFINLQGIHNLLTTKNQKELLNWIENEFVPGTKTAQVSVTTRSYEEIFGDVVKISVDVYKKINFFTFRFKR